MDTDEIKYLENYVMIFARFEHGVEFLMEHTGFNMKTCIVWLMFLYRQAKIDPRI